MSVVGLIAGLIGTVATLYALYRTSPPRPAVQVRGHVVAEVAEGIRDRATLTLDGDPVPRVTLYLVYFWNAGWRALRKEDIAEPISFCFDGQIRDVQTEFGSRRASQVDARFDETCLTPTFLYLNRREGAVFGVYGTGGLLPNLTAVGDVVDVRRGVKIHPTVHWTGFGNPRRARGEAVTALMGFVAFLAAWIVSFFGPPEAQFLGMTPNIGRIAFGVATVGQVLSLHTSAQSLGWFVPRGLRRAGRRRLTQEMVAS